jgi:predicted glycosyltransferase
MKLAVYCQHVLGLGHLHRAIELCRAFRGHRVLLLTGGPPVNVELPEHVRRVQLPALRMDADFGGLSAVDARVDLGTVKRRRQEMLERLFWSEKPDCLMTELYPFGRKAFRFELDPLLETITNRAGSSCGIFSSVRDILVEKDNAAKHEARAVKLLNRYFDGVFVHADPRLVRLEETFGRFDEIDIPLVYTGYVAPRPPPGARERLRKKLRLAEGSLLVVASAGGGQVGYRLLQATVAAANLVRERMPLSLVVFTGPFMSREHRHRLKETGGDWATIETFSDEFLSYLAAADLSISMGGYNTTMNLLATHVPAMVLPFAQNREQQLRAGRLASRQALTLLTPEDLVPGRLAERMAALMRQPLRACDAFDLDGAAATARWIERWSRQRDKNR